MSSFYYTDNNLVYSWHILFHSFCGLPFNFFIESDFQNIQFSFDK